MIVERGRAVGVEVTDGKHGRERIHAGSEVILAAGAFNTPALLQHSGIGPADFLRSVGVEPIADLPAVGEHLMEHPLVYVTYELASGQLGMFDAEEPKHALKWILRRRGKLASDFAECGAHIRTDPSMPAPNFQLLFGAGFFFEHALMSWDAPAATIGCVVHRAPQPGPGAHTLGRTIPQTRRHVGPARGAVRDGRNGRRRHTSPRDRRRRSCPSHAGGRDHARR